MEFDLSTKRQEIDFIDAEEGSIPHILQILCGALAAGITDLQNVT